MRFRDGEGRTSRLDSRRLVHMRAPHLAALSWRFTAEDWSQRLQIRSALDGRVENGGVPRYRSLERQHLELLEAEDLGEGIYLKVRTRQSRLEFAQAARTRLFLEGAPLAAERTSFVIPGYAAELYSLELREGQTLTVEKTVVIYTSRDRAIAECGLAAKEEAERAGSFEELLGGHAQSWDHLWQGCDIECEIAPGSNGRAQSILRLHLFHLLQTVSHNSTDLDVGVPARGWHGEAYRGHIFWDELFIFPFLNFCMPELTRSLLLYRYRRLDEARHNARAAGLSGALYPWQSGSSGREETQRLHLNPRSGRWLPDHTHLQRHVNAAVAYNIWLYYKITHDQEFLSFYGAEIILEIARLFASLTSYNETLGRYEIRAVMGPDEFHDAYPDAERPGLDNNTYTNVMTVWVLGCALKVLELLGDRRRHELSERLSLSDEELRHWDEISRKMRLVFFDEKLLAQFEGYEALKEFDWEGYRARYGDIHRLDRLLEAKGDSVNRYKASKQADVLMLFYLFSAETLAGLFEQLGYAFSYETIPANIHYYLERTSHGSTLCKVVHAWVLARSDRAGSWRLFLDALESDISDVQGGTTREGIHLGAMAGTVDMIQRCYLGLEVHEDALWFNPVLPDELARLRVRLRYRGLWLVVSVDQETLTVTAERDWADEVTICVGGERYRLGLGEQRSFAYTRKRR
jgi:trehalose/maltose hydrolase-like predicted phosphorylase